MDSNGHSVTFHCRVLHFENDGESITDKISVEGQALCAKTGRVQSSREAHAD